MTTCLYSILASGADRVAVTDPHGFTLTLISVSVVFTALIILYILYSLSGKFFSRKSGNGESGAGSEVAAAIAMAIELSQAGPEEEVAVAAALALYLGESVHDSEPGIITIKHTESAWAGKGSMTRRSPVSNR